MIEDASYPESSAVTGLPEADLRTLAGVFKVEGDRIPVGVLTGIALYSTLSNGGMGGLLASGYLAREAAQNADPTRNRMLLAAISGEKPKMVWVDAGDPNAPVILAESPRAFITTHPDKIARMLQHDLALHRGSPSAAAVRAGMH